mgnify:CR=1 FL=1
MAEQINPSAQGLGAFLRFAVSGEIKELEDYIRRSAGNHDFYKGESPLFAKMIKAYGYPETFDNLGRKSISHRDRHARPYDRDDLPTAQEIEDSRSHMLTSAEMARRFGEDTVSSATSFHEQIDRFTGTSTAEDSAMDLRNNALGFEIAREAGPDATFEDLRRRVDSTIMEQLGVLFDRTPEQRAAPVDKPFWPANFSNPEQGPALYFPRDERGFFNTGSVSSSTQRPVAPVDKADGGPVYASEVLHMAKGGPPDLYEQELYMGIPTEESLKNQDKIDLMIKEKRARELLEAEEQAKRSKPNLQNRDAAVQDADLQRRIEGGAKGGSGLTSTSPLEGAIVSNIIPAAKLAGAAVKVGIPAVKAAVKAARKFLQKDTPEQLNLPGVLEDAATAASAATGLPALANQAKDMFTEPSDQGLSKRRLLVVSCSGAKNPVTCAVEASKLYKGQLWQALNKHFGGAENVPKGMEDAGVDLHILSAEHGLIPANELIENYDREMTGSRKKELLSDKEITQNISDVMGRYDTKDVFVAAHKNYRQLIEEATGREFPTFKPGSGIGSQKGELGEWLRQNIGPRPTGQGVGSLAKQAKDMTSGPRPTDQATGVERRAYHATNEEFEGFDSNFIGSSTDSGHLGHGFYWTTDPKINEPRDPLVKGKRKNRLVEANLTLNNPLEVSLPDWRTDKRAVVREALGLPETATARDISAALSAKGHDGVVLDYSPTGYNHQEIMVLDANQISPLTNKAHGGPIYASEILHMQNGSEVDVQEYLKGEMQKVNAPEGGYEVYETPLPPFFRDLEFRSSERPLDPRLPDRSPPITEASLSVPVGPLVISGSRTTVPEHTVAVSPSGAISLQAEERGIRVDNFPVAKIGPFTIDLNAGISKRDEEISGEQIAKTLPTKLVNLGIVGSTDRVRFYFGQTKQSVEGRPSQKTYWGGGTLNAYRSEDGSGRGYVNVFLNGYKPEDGDFGGTVGVRGGLKFAEGGLASMAPEARAMFSTPHPMIKEPRLTSLGQEASPGPSPGVAGLCGVARNMNRSVVA